MVLKKFCRLNNILQTLSLWTSCNNIPLTSFLIFVNINTVFQTLLQLRSIIGNYSLIVILQIIQWLLCHNYLLLNSDLHLFKLMTWEGQVILKISQTGLNNYQHSLYGRPKIHFLCIRYWQVCMKATIFSNCDWKKLLYVYILTLSTTTVKDDGLGFSPINDQSDVCTGAVAAPQC